MEKQEEQVKEKVSKSPKSKEVKAPNQDTFTYKEYEYKFNHETGKNERGKVLRENVVMHYSHADELNMYKVDRKKEYVK